MQTKADRMCRVSPDANFESFAAHVDDNLDVVPVGYRVALGHTETECTIRMSVQDEEYEYSEAKGVTPEHWSKYSVFSGDKNAIVRRWLRAMATRLTKKARAGR